MNIHTEQGASIANNAAIVGFLLSSFDISKLDNALRLQPSAPILPMQGSTIFQCQCTSVQGFFGNEL